MHAGAMTDGSDDGEQVLMAMSTLQEEGVMAVKQVCVCVWGGGHGAEHATGGDHGGRAGCVWGEPGLGANMAVR